MRGESLEGEFLEGESFAGETGSKKSTQEFGSKICFPEFGPEFGFRRCKIPCACAEICP